MSPEIAELSRTFGALHGAPIPTRTRSGDSIVFRDPRGCRWRAYGGDEEGMDWLLDLTDPATGGVLFCRLDGGQSAIKLTLTAGYSVIGPLGVLGSGATLAEAVARLAVALGRAA